MAYDEFYDLIPRSFFNKLKGDYERIQNQIRETWEQTRWSTALLINIQLPKGKQVKATDLIRFPWDKKTKKVQKFSSKNDVLESIKKAWPDRAQTLK